MTHTNTYLHTLNRLHLHSIEKWTCSVSYNNNRNDLLSKLVYKRVYCECDIDALMWCFELELVLHSVRMAFERVSLIGRQYEPKMVLQEHKWTVIKTDTPTLVALLNAIKTWTWANDGLIAGFILVQCVFLCVCSLFSLVQFFSIYSILLAY